MIHDSASTPEIVAKQRAQEMWSVRLYLQPSVASVAISSVTRLLDGLEQENKKAAYSLHFTTVTMVFASIVSFHPWSLVDPGEGARPPLFLDQTEAWRAENIFLETAPLSSKGLEDPPPPPPPPSYLKVWIWRCWCKGIWIVEESEKFLLVESRIWQMWVLACGILGSGVQNTAQGIWNPTNVWNLKSKLHWQRIQKPEIGILNPQRGIQNPRWPWIPLYGVISLHEVRDT